MVPIQKRLGPWKLLSKMVEKIKHFSFLLLLQHMSYTMSNFTIMNGRGIGRQRRYNQGRGKRRRRGHGPKMQVFKGIMKIGLALEKKHLLPHIKEIGKNVLLDALEGRNIGQSLKTHMKRAALSSLGRRRRYRS